MTWLGVVQLVLKGLAGAFIVLAALCTYCHLRFEGAQARVREWFGAKWEGLRSSQWLSMPEKVIRWAIQAKALTGHRLHVLAFSLGRKTFMIIAFPPMIVAMTILHRPIGRAALCNLPLTFFCCWAFYRLIASDFPLIERRFGTWKCNTAVRLSAAACGATWVVISLQVPHLLASAIMLLALPSLWGIIALTQETPADRVETHGAEADRCNRHVVKETRWGSSVLLLTLACGLSSSLTFLAYHVGSLLAPQSPVPLDVQVLISNAFFDGLTVVTTFALLTWAVKRKAGLRIPLAVVADIVLAAVFACASLHFAFLFSARTIYAHEVLLVLVGRSLDGSHIELGPRFWMMHTTFIPTLLYLGVILLAWLGKIAMRPIEWLLRTHKEHDKPLALSAAFCGVVVAVLVVLSELVGAIDTPPRTGKSAAPETSALRNGYGRQQLPPPLSVDSLERELSQLGDIGYAVPRSPAGTVLERACGEVTQ